LFCSALRIRRTTRRPGTCLGFFCEANAVNGTSATSATEIQRLVSSSKIASGYWMVCHPLSGIVAMARWTGAVILGGDRHISPRLQRRTDTRMPVIRRVRPDQDLLLLHSRQASGGSDRIGDQTPGPAG